MEVYVLDSQFRRETVVDLFESLVWTERFAAYGDFELVVQSTPANRRLLRTGVRLALNESYRVMTLETVEDSTDSEGKATLTLTGRSLEQILDDRVAKDVLGNSTDNPKWALDGTPTAIARKIFHDICVTGVLSQYDKIDRVIEGKLLPNDTIGEPSGSIHIDLEPKSVYAAIKELADAYSFGFRLLRNFDKGELYWDVYMGSDRTTAQTGLPSVIFAPNLDNLQNTKELTSIANYKNTAYVITPVGSLMVYANGTNPQSKSFERRIMVVMADDITLTDPVAAQAAMQQRGLEELAKNPQVSAFDGEIDQNSQYKYGVHYNLGDLVELRNTDGATNQMRVTEQIFASDQEGDRAYPTLEINQFITPGSWLAWDFNQVWPEVSDTVTWQNASGG